MTTSTFTPRTQDEISSRITRASDWLGFDREVLLEYLDFEHAKPYLVEDATAKEWRKAQAKNDEAAIRAAARKYLEFAWGKTQDHRGISAGRSVAKLTEWAWLLGLDELVADIESDRIPYAQYGAPILAAFAAALDLPIPDDKGLRRMIDGRPCRSDCDEGCG